MLYSLLDQYRSVSLGESALYALLGFLTVFCGIAFLIFVVWLVGKIMVAVQSKPVKVQKVAEEPVASVVSEEDVSDETVAVIMAALMAYYQVNNPKCEFKVKRIKRI